MYTTSARALLRSGGTRRSALYAPRADALIGPRRLSVYVIALCLSFVASFTTFDDPLWQVERWVELNLFR